MVTAVVVGVLALIAGFAVAWTMGGATRRALIDARLRVETNQKEHHHYPEFSKVHDLFNFKNKG